MTIHPSKGTFNYPPFGKDHKSFRLKGTQHRLQYHATGSSRPLRHTAFPIRTVRENDLEPVTVLNEENMNGFLDRVENAIGQPKAGTGPNNTACKGCGIRGPGWTLPSPGETLHFHVDK